MMRNIKASMIRPQPDYAEVLWSPHKENHVLKLERIQRIATKIVTGLTYLTHEERLKEMQPSTLEERRERRLNYNA